MFYATLICTDPECAEELEGWGELEELDGLLCVSCGCQLLALGFGELRLAAVTELPRRTPHERLRDAA